MDGAERAAFVGTPGWREAVELRRLEDATGKSLAAVSTLESYRGLLETLAG